MEDVAVIGIGCRFPGSATSPAKLWEVLAKGESAWSEFPKDRFNLDGFYHPDNKRQGSISIRGAHFLKDDIAAWDPSFFGMHAGDAAAADPQHRILLEVSYEAVENAGLRKEDIENTNTAVFVGTFTKDYEQISSRDSDRIPKYAATGSANAILASRISWFYNLRGTCQAIDTACSGSLVAVHQAVRCLQTHDSNMAIVGGAGMILAPEVMMTMDSMGFLSKDGKCFTFDHRANGYGRGEGCGVVILKRLSDALRDNDTIRGVIRGSRTNHDGRTAGITLPNGDAQAENIRATYEQAGLDYAQTGYVECHGTGTPSGDTTELRALAVTVSGGDGVENAATRSPLVVGSVKTNIGHLEGAAGIAGLIKAILCLEHGRIPPTINFEKGNPKIDFDGWNIRVPLRMMEWPIDGPRRASVNSFGFGGTNAHVIIDEASAYLASKGLKGNHNSSGYPRGQHGEPQPAPMTEVEKRVGLGILPLRSQQPGNRTSQVECLVENETIANRTMVLRADYDYAIRVNFPQNLKAESILEPGVMMYPHQPSPSQLSSPVAQSRASTVSVSGPPSPVSSTSIGFGSSSLAEVDSLDFTLTVPTAQSPMGLRLEKKTGLDLDTRGRGHEVDASTSDSPSQLFVFSANDKNGAKRTVQASIDFLMKQKSSGAKLPGLSDFLYTVNSRRSMFEWRTFYVANTLSNFLETVGDAATTKTQVMRATTKSKSVCFVFSGQGIIWATMGLGLCCFPVFRASLEAADKYMSDILGSSFSLLEELMEESGASKISTPAISQPAVTAVQVALVDLFESFGIVPSSVIGHSSGEVAAAYTSKAITREQAWAIAYWRGFFCQCLVHQEPNGGMIVVGMSAGDSESYIRDNRLSLEVACINSPALVTLSGEKSQVDEIHIRLQSRAGGEKVFSRVLDIPVAYHSRQMVSICDEYKAALGGITPNATPDTPKLFSSVTGKEINKEDLGPDYWVTNLMSQVKFSLAMESAAAEVRPDLFIEIGPSNSLKSCILPNIGDNYVGSGNPEYFSALNQKQPGSAWTLRTVGECWMRGLPVKLDKAIARTGTGDEDSDSGSSKNLPQLPSYPWNHEKKYWHAPQITREHCGRAVGRKDLVGVRTLDSTPFSAQYRHVLRTSENPWIQDHQVQRTILYPASGMVAMMIEGSFMEAGVHRVDLAGFFLEDFHIFKPLIVPAGESGLQVHLAIRPTDQQSRMMSYRVEVYSRLALDTADWTFNSSASLRIVTNDEEELADLDMDFESYGPSFEKAKAKCLHQVSPRQLYEAIDVVGMNYGPLFRNVEEVCTPADPDDRSECVGTIRVPDTKSHMPAHFEFDHFVHPATLDSMFHLLFALDDDAMVPVSIDKIWIDGSLVGTAGDVFDGHVVAHQKPEKRSAEACVVMNNRGSDWRVPSVIIDGAHFAKVPLPSPREGGFIPSQRNLTSHVVWKEDLILARRHDNFEHFLELLCHKFPEMSVLQVGGDAKLTMQILDIVSEHDYHSAPPFTRFSISDHPNGDDTLSQLRIEYGETAPLLRYVEHRQFCPDATGPAYNLIILGGVAEAPMASLADSLRPDGYIVDLRQGNSGREPTTADISPPKSISWTNVNDDEPAQSSALIFPPKSAVNNCQVSEVVIMVPGIQSRQLYSAIKGVQGRLLGMDIQSNIMTWESLSKNPKGFDELIGARHCISLLCLDGSSSRTPLEWTEADLITTRRLLGVAKSLLWVTILGETEELAGDSLFTSLVTGLTRTIRSENSTKRVFELSLAGFDAVSAQYRSPEERVSDLVLKVFEKTVLGNLTFGPVDCEYSDVYSPGRIAIPRLQLQRPLNQLIDGNHDSTLKRLQVQDSGDYHLHQFETGIEDVHRQWVERLEAPPQLHDSAVEVQIITAVLGHHDLRAVDAGDWPLQLGTDVVGKVIRVGRNVASIKVGSHVIAAVNGGLRNRITIHEGLVCEVDSPAEISRDALLSRHLAAIFWVEGVEQQMEMPNTNSGALIKDGSSSWGMAAIQVAIANGWRVSATVREEHIDALRLLGVNILNCEAHEISLDSFATVFDATDGIPCNMAESIARLTEVGMTEPPKVLLLAFEKAKALLKAVLNGKAAHSPIHHDLKSESVESVLREIRESHADEAHLLNLAPDTTIEVKLSREVAPLADAVGSRETYVLVGAFGGLGETIARILVGGGAKNLVFLSRSGEDRPDARAFVDSLRSEGVTVRSFKVDICQLPVLERVWAEITANGSIAGVVQCAAVLKDSAFENLTFADWQDVIRPKTVGTQNIIKVASTQLEGQQDGAQTTPWFLFLSSAAGIIGNRGQAAYAAANTYLDALATHLARKGVPAAAVAFGPVLGTGMLARSESAMDHLRASGFFGIRPADFRLIVSRVIHSLALGRGGDGNNNARRMLLPPVLVVGIGTGGLIRQNKPADPYWTRHPHYRRLNLVDVPYPDLQQYASDDDGTADGVQDQQVDMARRLAGCQTEDEAADVILEGLVTLLAKTVSALPEDIDVQRSAAAYGVDSLLAATLVSWTLANVGVPVSVFEMTADVGLKVLAENLARRVMEQKEEKC